MGMCWIQYPDEPTNPIGIIDYGFARFSQQYGTRWSDIETAAGIYDSAALAELDSKITFQRENGKHVCFGVYGTPRFYADNTTNKPTVTDFNARGPWNGLGECAYPTSLTALENYTTMIVNRYNRPGGAWYDANFATLGKGIQSWEPWNEPSFPNANNSPAIGQKGNGFFWGTGVQMVDMCATQYDVIQARDNTIIFSSPGFSGTGSGKTFLTTMGSTARTGFQVSQRFSWHPYGRTPLNMTYKRYNGDVLYGGNGILDIQQYMYANNVKLPLWITEWGLESGDTNPDIQAWYAEPPAFRYQWIGRTVFAMMLGGVDVWCPWHWDITSMVSGAAGSYRDDIDGVQAIFNYLAEEVAGRTFVDGGYRSTGEVYGVRSDGATITI
jgi:hypothetical protein